MSRHCRSDCSPPRRYHASFCSSTSSGPSTQVLTPSASSHGPWNRDRLACPADARDGSQDLVTEARRQVRRSDHPIPEHPWDVEGRKVSSRKARSQYEHPSAPGFVEHPRELVDEIFEGDGTRLRVHWQRILEGLGGGHRSGPCDVPFGSAARTPSSSANRVPSRVRVRLRRPSPRRRPHPPSPASIASSTRIAASVSSVPGPKISATPIPRSAS